jgi:hypothetical protein
MSPRWTASSVKLIGAVLILITWIVGHHHREDPGVDQLPPVVPAASTSWG